MAFVLLFCVSVPWQHYQPTKGVDGVRVDKDRRPELSMGSYEILNSHKVSFNFAFININTVISKTGIQYSCFGNDYLRCLFISITNLKILPQGEPAALLLAIDVSASALRGGHLEFVAQQIHTLLTSLNR